MNDMPVHLSVMTYNTHSSVGTDGQQSPSRIAEVITTYAPDVIALQELNVSVESSGSIDQVRYIADRIGMDYHFHPSRFIEDGQFGNAVLSHFDMRLIRAGHLPGLPHRSHLEKRGALWVEVMVDKQPVQVITLHMGLERKERLAQAHAPTGPEWLGSRDCKGPVILCGDFNAFPCSGVHRIISARLRDAHAVCGRPKATWPSRLPLVRIDYVFTSASVRVDDCFVPRTRLTRLASDHLPLMARLSVSTSDCMSECV